MKYKNFFGGKNDKRNRTCGNKIELMQLSGDSPQMKCIKEMEAKA